MAKSNVIGWEEYQAKRAAEKSPKTSSESSHIEKISKSPKKTKLLDAYKDMDIDYDEDGVIDTSDGYPYKGNSRGTKYTKNTDKVYSGALAPRCYTTHKPLKIGEYVIYGGSCSSPMIKDADIYVGFEKYMLETTKAYPWVEGESFCFPITDGSVPTSIEDTMQLLEYLSTNLKAGKKIHIGCIGGHGRTGTILAALVKYMTGNVNATEYVRTNYCEKVVESTTQVNWLHKHFGIEKVKPSKSYTTGFGSQSSFGFTGNGKSNGVSKNYSDVYANKSTASDSSFVLFETVKPVRVKGNIFGF